MSSSGFTFSVRAKTSNELGSHGREELVEVEGQRVELLAPAVRLEAPELVPPMVAPVPPHRAIGPVDGVVKEESHQCCHERLRREWHVDHVVKLSKNTMVSRPYKWLK